MNGLPAGPALCVVLHDVAEVHLPACERVLRAIGEVAPLPLTLLAVPHHHGRAASRTFEQWLAARHAAGAELALHGWSHRDDGRPQSALDWLRRRVYTRGEGEFWSLPADEATRRLDAGAAWFARNGWTPRGFVAPAWLLGPGAWRALRGHPAFVYTATLRHLHLLAQKERSASRGVVYSCANAWRRNVSIGWAALNAASQRRRPLLRFELHPADDDHARVRRSWQRLLEAALRERAPCTVADWVESWRATLQDAAARSALNENRGCS